MSKEKNSMSRVSGTGTATVNVGDPDFADRPVPASARTSWVSVTMVTLGVVGAMVFLQVPGGLVLGSGVWSTVIALVYAAVATGLIATVLAVLAARHGVSSNLLSRGAGFGVTGSRITGVFYAVNFVVLAATEGSIMASAMHAWIDAVPLQVWMVVLTGVNILLNWYGMAFLEKFQKYTLPVYLVLLVTSVIVALNTSPTPADLPSGVSWEATVTGIGVLNGIVALQALLTADYARFIRTPTIARCAVVGFTPQIGSFLVMGCVGMWFAARFTEPNPGVYLVMVLGGWGALYTLVSQIRINLINIYSGSLSLQASVPVSTGRWTRVIWVSVTALLSLAAMLADLISHLGDVLTVLGAFMFAWVAILVADALFARRWRLGDDAPAADPGTGDPGTGDPGTLVALFAGAAVGGFLSVGPDSWLLNATSGFVSACVAVTVHSVSALVSRRRRLGRGR